MKFLKPFNDITEVLSGSKYPTSNLYFHNVWKIHQSLLEEISHGDTFMRKMAKDMKKKFDKYWVSYSIILTIAVIFDPRYKLTFVEYAFGKIYRFDPKANEMIGRVRTNLIQVFDEYQRMEVTDVGRESHLNTIDTRGHGDPTDWEEVSIYENSKNVERGDKSELDLYLDEPRISVAQDFDILAFWKRCGNFKKEVAKYIGCGYKDIFKC
ncbi:hypothetical protein NE237_004152 [Protea cynaroides]|uniref:hAT-like transposase RNase-H fold domain-containing protein n=1 Tax=Protea cynaroides TaxID=273540 RepID=A0A9Q0QT96_9MAGN|nr:hypothetical protein NE237_004152 [Protea cynaroides]